MSILNQTKDICRLYNIYPQKSKGQNFLINEEIYQDIIEKSQVEDKNVLEVGPGLGFLTSKLAKSAKKVVAVEKDEKLVEFLQSANSIKNFNNLEIINQDILEFNPFDYFYTDNKNYHIVANLPYNISSIFLRTYLSSPFPPLSLFLMLQKEVAERIIAKEPNMSLLALSVNYYAKAEIVKIVKAENFWPIPKVDSALIKIDYKKERLKDFLVSKEILKEDKKYFQLAKIGFSAKRKMLKNNLSTGLKIEEDKVLEIFKKINIKDTCRAQELSLNDWSNLRQEIFG